MYKYDLTLDEAKDVLKKLQKDKKQIVKTRQRKVLSTQYVCLEHIFDFVQEQNKDFYNKMQKEKDNSWFNLNNPSEEIILLLDKHKLHPKEAIKVDDYINLSYPDINENLWANEFEQEKLLDFIKCQQ